MLLCCRQVCVTGLVLDLNLSDIQGLYSSKSCCAVCMGAACHCSSVATCLMIINHNKRAPTGSNIFCSLVDCNTTRQKDKKLVLQDALFLTAGTWGKDLFKMQNLMLTILRVPVGFIGSAFSCTSNHFQLTVLVRDIYSAVKKYSLHLLKAKG